MAPTVKRDDLIVRYIHTPPKTEGKGSAMVSQSMPMAALFMKNKLLSWFSLLNGVTGCLNKLHGAPIADDQMSPLLTLAMALLGIAVCYMDLVFPSSSGFIQKRAVEEVAEGISSTVAAAAATAAATAAGN
ncbi:hypothetical protein WICPIJ_000035 [Wickerhamomyces pijperi]|uniref:Uncharacterized protein n=1 Tax=Wickerhamomyces pijperi TaxID=599730 RepID=A0A9P8QES6_WICPI|nr:hypothetical protein WICPIJ_000035 [Wickerhamomyces pijperi]